MGMNNTLNHYIQEIYYYFYFLSAADDKGYLPLTMWCHVLLLFLIMCYTVKGFIN